MQSVAKHLMIYAFLKYLQYEKNYSSHTVLSYRIDLLQFCEFLRINPEEFAPSRIHPATIQQWVLGLMKTDTSARTISRKISTLKSFWRYLMLHKLSEKNPTSKIILPKTKKTIPAFYKQSEMEQAIHSFDELKSFKDVRNSTIIRLFYETGIRVSELISLRDNDFNIAAKELKVTGKRNKQRIVPLGDDVCKQLSRYLEVRNYEVELFSDKLFVRENGQAMYSKAVYNIVHERMPLFATLYKQSPHVLRHTFATTLMNNGADINAVKDLLGHSSLAATQVYTHVNFSEIKDIYKQTHPREAIKKGGKL